MNLRKRILVLIVILLGASQVSSTAWAGSKQQHRWEGVAIGVGAAILGNAIFQAYRANSPPPARVACSAPVPEMRQHDRQECRGYWQSRRIWVPPTYERVWNPGHYSPRGHWVPGQWIDVKKCEGYWSEERVWVADRHWR